MFNSHRYCQIAFHSGGSRLHCHRQCVSSTYAPSLVAHAVTSVRMQGHLVWVCLRRGNSCSVFFPEFGLKHRARYLSPQSRYRGFRHPQTAWCCLFMSHPSPVPKPWQPLVRSLSLQFYLYQSIK